MPVSGVDWPVNSSNVGYKSTVSIKEEVRCPGLIPGPLIKIGIRVASS